MTRKAPKMTIAEFQSILPSTYLGSIWDPSGVFYRVHADMEKIYTGVENLIDDSTRLYRYVGFHTLDTGLTFLGLQCWKDGGWPVFVILYHDGENFRGYVPDRGNTVCLMTTTAHPAQAGNQYLAIPRYDAKIRPLVDDDAMLNEIRAKITVTDDPVITPRYPKPVCISTDDFHDRLPLSDFVGSLSGEDLPEGSKDRITHEPFTHLVVDDWGWATILYWDGEKIVDHPVPKSIPNTPSTDNGVARSGLGGCPTIDDINRTIRKIGELV